MTFISVYKNHLKGVQSSPSSRRQTSISVQRENTSHTSSVWSVPLVICKSSTIFEITDLYNFTLNTMKIDEIISAPLKESQVRI